MPALVKIGHTSRDSMTERMRELFTTGVACAFDCAYAAQVEDSVEVEKTIHDFFAGRRLLRREFFVITSQKDFKAIKKYKLKDRTIEMREEADSFLTEKEHNERKQTRAMLGEFYPEVKSSKDAHNRIKASKS